MSDALMDILAPMFEEAELKGEIKTFLKLNYSVEDIAKELNINVSEVRNIIDSI